MTPYYIIPLFLVSFTSCKIFNPAASDRKMARYVSRKMDLVASSAGYFLSLDSAALKDDPSVQKRHRKMQRKLRRIGNDVTITYVNPDSAKPWYHPHALDPDSTIIFKNWSFWRVSEVLYDFSVQERDLSNAPWGKQNGEYYRKIGNRIYLKRSLVPMM